MYSMNDEDLIEVVLKMIEKTKGKSIDAGAKNLSYDDFVVRELKRLNESVKDKKVVYLDTKYWVYFQKVVRGDSLKNDDALYIDLYDLIKQKVSENKLICPISTDNFTELLRQTAVDTKKETAKIMAEFSKGIALKPFFERIEDEFYNFLVDCTDSKVEKAFRFDFIFNVLGTMKIYGLPDEIKKEVYLYFQNMSFEDFACMGNLEKDDVRKENDGMARVSCDMNQFKQECQGKTFKEIFDIAISTEIISFKFYIREALRKLESAYRKIPVDLIPKDFCPENKLDKFASAIIYCFKNNKFKKEDMSLLYIQSVLNTVFVKDGNRKFKDHDYDDIRHAAEALSSSDYFFTERSLANALNNLGPKLASVYNVKVVADPCEAIKLIEVL